VESGSQRTPLAPEDFDAAADAGRYFDLSELAAVMLRVSGSNPESDDELQAVYDRLVRDDQVLADAFE
jgi:hypothetical protein